MGNTVNYASRFERPILEATTQKALTNPFITSKVRWLNAQTINFTQMTVPGMKDYTRDAGSFGAEGSVIQTNKPYTLSHERAINIGIEKIDMDESNQTLTMANIMSLHTDTQFIPEMDAHCFSSMATDAAAAQTGGTATGTVYEETAPASFTVANIYTTLVQAVSKTNLKLYRSKGSSQVIGYIASDLMDLLSLSSELEKKIDVVRNEASGIDTRVFRLNGIDIYEVIDTDRFYTKYDFTDGFEVVAGESKAINFILVAVETVKTVPKLDSVYLMSPGEHTSGDRYLMLGHLFWDTFIFPNGKDGKIDGIYVNASNTAVSAS